MAQNVTKLRMHLRARYLSILIIAIVSVSSVGAAPYNSTNYSPNVIMEGLISEAYGSQSTARGHLPKVRLSDLLIQDYEANFRVRRNSPANLNMNTFILDDLVDEAAPHIPMTQLLTSSKHPGHKQKAVDMSASTRSGSHSNRYNCNGSGLKAGASGYRMIMCDQNLIKLRDSQPLSYSAESNIRQHMSDVVDRLAALVPNIKKRSNFVL